MTYIVGADPGKMKHTFTGLRTAFPNSRLHLFLASAYIPFRKELLRRKEVGNSSSGITEPLRTKVLENLQFFMRQLQQYTAETGATSAATLDERIANRTKFMDAVLDKSMKLETLAEQSAATHTDQVLGASVSAINTLTFDYEGVSDRDMAQPTPDRVPSIAIRALIVGLDRLIVDMTNSHSAENQFTFVREDVTSWITRLSDMYHEFELYNTTEWPYLPTNMSLNEVEQRFNADGSFDIAVTEGDTGGEVNDTVRTGLPTSRATAAVATPVTGIR